MAVTDEEIGKLMKRFREHPESFNPEARAELAYMHAGIECWSNEMATSVAFDAKGKFLKAGRPVFEQAEATRDHELADLDTHISALNPDDLVAVAKVNLAKAEVMATFKVAERTWLAINDAFDEAEIRYDAAVKAAELHPIPGCEP